MIEVQIIEKRYKDRTYLINELNHNFKTINQIAIENSVSYTTIIGWILKNGLNELLKKTQIKRHMGPGSKKVNLKLTDNQKFRVRTMSKAKRSNYNNFGLEDSLTQ